MNARKMTQHPLSIILIACAIFPLLLTACQPVNVSTSLPPVQPAATLPAAEVPAADLPAADMPTQPPAELAGEIVLDLMGVAQDQTVETIAAVPASPDAPWWEAAPEYRLVTLQGYPVQDHNLKPQITLYPVDEMAGFNENAGKNAADLQALLNTQQAGEDLPFLPLFNATQVMHAQVQYMNFANGKGVRFLTQFDQAPIPVNNDELLYTFQGLTSDGKYYVAAVLPVTHPELPDNAQINEQQAAEFMTGFPAYMAETVTWLEQQPTSSFTPDLATLDALIQSIEVK